MIKKIREKLIQIPWICKLGTMRRNLFQYKWKLESIDWKTIRERYADGKQLSQETFFIVHDRQEGGIFVYLIGCMVQIAYALQNGYIPVVDMLNFPSALRNDDQVDVNAWELYFKQPADIRVQDVYGAEHIIFHGEETCKLLYIGDVDSNKIYEEHGIVIDENKEFKVWYQNPELMKRFKDFWHTNMHYSDNAEAYIERQYKKLFSGGGER